MTSKAFRSYDLRQSLLLPPDLNDWLPEDHLARFVADVVGSLDLSAFYRSYQDGRGLAAYHPEMMVSLLLYGYCVGVRSSRKLERAAQEDVGFRFITGNQLPRHSAIAAFRRRHLQAMEDLFVAVFALCVEAGLVQLGHVAIDGTKIRANASKHKAMSWGRLDEREAHWRGIAQRLLEEAEAADQEEDERHGPDGSERDLPAELARAEGRLERIAQARESLQRRAREAAEAERSRAQERLEQRTQEEAATGTRLRGRKPIVPDPDQAVPAESDQYNFTDPDSRIMKDGATKAFVQAYNAQLGIDGSSGVIIGTYVTDHANDKRELLPVLDAITARTDGGKPDVLSADTGYFSKQALNDPRLTGVDVYIPPDGRVERAAEKASAADGGHHPPPEETAPLAERMRFKLRTATGKQVYKMRKAIAEGPIGIIKEAMGFRRFSVRGMEAVNGEWMLVTAAYNLRKLFRAGGQFT